MARLLVLILIVALVYPVLRGYVSVSPVLDTVKNFNSLSISGLGNAVQSVFNEIVSYYKNFAVGLAEKTLTNIREGAQKIIGEAVKETVQNVVLNPISAVFKRKESIPLTKAVEGKNRPAGQGFVQVAENTVKEALQKVVINPISGIFNKEENIPSGEANGGAGEGSFAGQAPSAGSGQGPSQGSLPPEVSVAPQTPDKPRPEGSAPTSPSRVIEQSEPYDMPVLVMRYFPLKGDRLDPAITGMNSSLSEIRTKTKQLVYGIADLLTKSSVYHGYKASKATPSLKFRIFEEREFLEPLPIGLEVPWKRGQGIYRPDYYNMLSDINICDYVDRRGVKVVWVVGYHYGAIEPVESNMSMGKISKAFWNFATYGDISNSEQTNDLPTCEKTYVLQNLNYSRDIGMEAFGHHLESVFRWIDSDLFWNKFVGPYGETDGARRCGWMHYPPNVSTKSEYDFRNEASALSDCEDWKPDGSGAKKVVSCRTWYKEIVGSDSCTGDTEGYAFQSWWAQNIPGKGNTLTYKGRPMRNWWEFIGDFDEALKQGKQFYLQEQESVINSPF